MAEIKLVSSDAKEFKVPIDIAQKSVTINTMLQDLEMEDGNNDEAVPLPNVDGTILEKVIEWCTKHKDDAADKFSATSMSSLPEWDEKTFFNKGEDQKLLFDLILAANYLDIKGIIDIGCKIVAKQIQNCKDAEAIRQKFNIKNDLPAETEVTA